MIHDLKILPEYFVEVVRGNKTFEVRKDDRPFNVGDELILYEVNCGRYTGRNIKVIITYILRNPDYCKEGYCILGFKQPVNQWISVKKRLPDENQKCLVYRDINADLKITTGIWHSEWKTFDGLRHGTRLEDTIAWMPLPELPKDGDTE